MLIPQESWRSLRRSAGTEITRRLWRAGLGDVGPTGHSIRPQAFPTGGSGLGFENGGIETVLKPEPACVQGCWCPKQGVLVGELLDPQNSEEVEQLAEDEQAENVAKLPTPHQPTLCKYLDIV